MAKRLGEFLVVSAFNNVVHTVQDHSNKEIKNSNKDADGTIQIALIWKQAPLSDEKCQEKRDLLG